MLKVPIHITAISSISSLGNSLEEAWNSYQNSAHFLDKVTIENEQVWLGKLKETTQKEIEKIRISESRYKNLDDSVLYGIYTSRRAIKRAGWDSSDNFGINIGSSRGATSLFEKHHKSFLSERYVPTSTSPTTTLGNISSWVAHDLKSRGPAISHSITCSTALHALLNGIAWIQSGLTNTFLAGGSEASLTPFTIAQMRAMKIYTDSSDEWPNRALDLKKRENTLVLGEAASIACIEKEPRKKTLAEIVGIGYATEPLEHGASLSTDADCFQKSMQMAIVGLPKEAVDAIVMHAPGTIKGDLAEYNAIKTVFGDAMPLLTTNKWKMGHTFGASGMLSIEMAVLMLKHQKFIPTPFFDQDQKGELSHILVNAVGFGGNAVSILLKLPNSK